MKREKWGRTERLEMWVGSGSGQGSGRLENDRASREVQVVVGRKREVERSDERRSGSSGGVQGRDSHSTTTYSK